MAVKEKRCDLIQDKKGMWWDVALYVPTVVFLASLAAKMWYSADQNWAYLFVFLATIFLLVGINRIFGTRLMMFPQSALSIDANKSKITFQLRNGDSVNLVKGVRYYPDFAGKSFAVTGMDLNGKKRQHVFHKGQFADEGEYKEMREFLRIYG